VDFESVAVNLRESFRAIAASRAPGEIRELRGVSIASAGVTFQMFNSAASLRKRSEPGTLIRSQP